MTIVYIPVKQLTLGLGLVQSKRETCARLASLKNSILKDGLLNPLIVVKRRNKYFILDGKKRFQSIKALLKSKTHSRALKHIPCILEQDTLKAAEAKRPVLMSDPELAHAIITEAKRGTSHPYISQRFDCDISVVEDAVSLTKLHLNVLQCFNNQTISLEQAAAFASIPNPTAQWDLLLQLGPFVSDEKIIEAIKTGQTVIDLPDDNTLILPSRKKAEDVKFDKAPLQSPKVFTQRLAA